MSENATDDDTGRQVADEVAAREPAPVDIDESKSAPADRQEAGPFDASEVRSMRPYVDLGGIKVAPREGLQLRLEVDERAKRVVAVSLTYAESLLQVQAFSAPKTLGLWHQVRAQISQQMTAQGGQVSETTGSLGPELTVTTALTAEQGGGTREARFVGVDGPRWLLRGVIMGKAVTDAAARAQVDELFRDLVVVRGDQPMPPSEPLPLQVPAGVPQTGTASTDPISGESGVQQA